MSKSTTKPTSRPVPDAAARDRITTELNRNLLVEAGAGSGKTQKLAERMAAGIATGTYELERMAAVTFTRKAAAELRGRFQLALEAELLKGGNAARQDRLRSALSNLERFFAGTIHSFCARLLRERPVEAGVSPGFTELDDAEERMVRKRSWRDYRAQAKAVADPDLLELLDAGITAKQLDKAFETVCLYEDVAFPPGEAEKPDDGRAWRELAEDRAAMRALLPSPVPDGSKCKTHDRAGRFARQWRAYERGQRETGLLSDLLRCWESKPDVTLKWWDLASSTEAKRRGKAAEKLHEDFRAATVVPHQTKWRQYLYRRCIALLTRARSSARADRRRRNALSFNDLLIMTADVLRTNTDVRRALQQKYRWLLVDEFQDTDPIQAEIMFLLAAAENGEAGAADWRTVALRPGALFVVGDPKQSIYRFRRADIDIYNEVRRRIGGDDEGGIVRLTSNFRSVPGLCEWANELFKTKFPAAPTPQAPMFARLDPYRTKGSGPDIAVLDLPATIDASDVVTEEAVRIARYIRAEVEAGRRRYGDFLILTRKKKGLRACAAELEALEVPVEVTGAGAFDESHEVRAIALLLDALADPQDAVALVGVLRGPLFGLSDRDLFAFRQAGGYFNLFAEIGTGDADAVRVGAALASLRQWFRWTRMLPAGAALERILEHSGYLALAATSPGGVQAGDLLHAIDRVRAVVESGFTLAEAAEVLASWSGLDDDGPDESTEVDSLPLEPGRRDVVRLMNLHKAKGLEAEVVFLADPLGGFDPRADVRIEREGAEPQGYFQIIAESDSFARRVLAEPQGWANYETTEKTYLTAELDRLLYVAATRAKDLLVVGRYGGSAGVRKPAWAPLLAAMGTAPLLVVPTEVSKTTPAKVDLSAAAAAKATTSAARAHEKAAKPSWSATSVTAEAKRLPRIAIEPTDATDLDPTSSVVPNTPSHRADAGMAWGSLIHGLLEHAMRHPAATRDDLRRLAMWLTVDALPLRAVIDQALDTVDTVKDASFWTEARASAECLEEVPFSVKQTDGDTPLVVSGAIDLAYKLGVAWRIVDYKTDQDRTTDALAKKYDEQIKAYEDAWKQLSGAPVMSDVVSTRRGADPEC